ncbi:MAG: radical SAM protein [Thermoleophilia bacterium]
MKKTLQISDHPCFNRAASRKFGRVHLAVAPSCNIHCNYCNRLFDCPNEGRPGVTSRLLHPEEALAHLGDVMAGAVPISVVGIAGPGDPLANPESTFRTLELVKSKYPRLLVCISTNGLAAAPLLKEVAKTTSHVTITVNALDAMVGASIYEWIRLDDRIYTGVEAAGILIERQLQIIQLLKRAGLIVKVNTVVIPGVNDHHVIDIARKMKELTVDIYNAMPVYPVKGTPFASVKEPRGREMRAIRDQARAFLPQMTHCARCRADAAGLIGHGAMCAEHPARASAGLGSRSR